MGLKMTACLSFAGNPQVKVGSVFAPVLLLALVLTGAAISGSASDFNIRTIHPGLKDEIANNPSILDAIGKANWALLLKVSGQVEDGGLTGIAETSYLPLSAQREIFRAIQGSPAVPEDIRLVLQDLIIQYYFFTYYYHSQNPREQEFSGEHRRFLQDLGIEYVWIEPAAQNYYQHTFLKKLVRTLPESRWGAFYRKIFDKTGFRELPQEGEGQADENVAEEDGFRSAASFTGEVRGGQVFEKYFGPGFSFRLEPRPLGWEIAVLYLDGGENIARLTPPFHFVPNPREIEGWHFRNSDNSGANEAGEKNVNAPGEEREFIFSPEVGAGIQSPESPRPPNEKDIEQVRSFGRGLLRIVEYGLGNLNVGEQAKFEWMRFEVHVSWPGEFGPLTFLSTGCYTRREKRSMP